MAKIIIIDDEPAMVEVIVTLCRDKGHQVFPFNSAPKAVEQLDTIQPQVVITDIKMETMSGFDVLRHVRENHRQTSVILITAYASVDTAIEAMKMGAYGYVPKPFKIDELQMTIQRALDFQAAVRENTYLRKELKNRYRFENIVGASRKMQSVYNLINKVADTDSTVLIIGESGTGKELVARGLHFNSNRQHHPFVAINCSALPENLLESELFGHKKGAFTGAVSDKRGLFEEANLGTIFLDEVNSMAPPLQTKLLRVLQEREVRRVGDNKSVPVNVRVVGATNEPLQGKIKDGSFREDLYYRLAVIPVEIPPLRERLEDVPLLVNHFLQKQASATGGEPKKIDPQAVECLCHYDCRRKLSAPHREKKRNRQLRRCRLVKAWMNSSNSRSAATSTLPSRTAAGRGKKPPVCWASAWRRFTARSSRRAKNSDSASAAFAEDFDLLGFLLQVVQGIQRRLLFLERFFVRRFHFLQQFDGRLSRFVARRRRNWRWSRRRVGGLRCHKLRYGRLRARCDDQHERDSRKKNAKKFSLHVSDLLGWNRSSPGESSRPRSLASHRSSPDFRRSYFVAPAIP